MSLSGPELISPGEKSIWILNITQKTPLLLDVDMNLTMASDAETDPLSLCAVIAPGLGNCH